MGLSAGGLTMRPPMIWSWRRPKSDETGLTKLAPKLDVGSRFGRLCVIYTVSSIWCPGDSTRDEEIFLASLHGVNIAVVCELAATLGLPAAAAASIDEGSFDVHEY